MRLGRHVQLNQHEVTPRVLFFRSPQGMMEGSKILVAHTRWQVAFAMLVLQSASQLRRFRPDSLGTEL